MSCEYSRCTLYIYTIIRICIGSYIIYNFCNLNCFMDNKDSEHMTYNHMYLYVFIVYLHIRICIHSLIYTYIYIYIYLYIHIHAGPEGMSVFVFLIFTVCFHIFLMHLHLPSTPSSQVNMMAELPSNVFLAEEFLEYFAPWQHQKKTV